MTDGRAMMQAPAASAPAVILGIGGVLPFIGLASMAGFGPDTWRDYLLTALSFYGAVILTFVGALHWGYALRRSAPAAEAWLQYGFSVVPAIAAWLSLLSPVWAALRLQAVGLLICYWFDRRMARKDPVPGWFLQLRAALTAVGAASLALASFL